MREFTYFKVKIRNIDYEFKKRDTKMKNITNRIQSNVWTLALLVGLCGCNKDKKNHEHTADGMSSHTAKVELDEAETDYMPTTNSTADMTTDMTDRTRPPSSNYDQSYI